MPRGRKVTPPDGEVPQEEEPIEASSEADPDDVPDHVSRAEYDAVCEENSNLETHLHRARELAAKQADEIADLKKQLANAKLPDYAKPESERVTAAPAVVEAALPSGPLRVKVAAASVHLFDADIVPPVVGGTGTIKKRHKEEFTVKDRSVVLRMKGALVVV